MPFSTVLGLIPSSVVHITLRGGRHTNISNGVFCGDINPISTTENSTDREWETTKGPYLLDQFDVGRLQ